MKQKYNMFTSMSNIESNSGTEFRRRVRLNPLRPLTLCRIPKTLTCKTCLFFLFFLELNFSFLRHFVCLHLSISYPVLLTLFAVAAILNTSPSSLETCDLLCELNTHEYKQCVPQMVLSLWVIPAKRTRLLSMRISTTCKPNSHVSI